VADGSTLEEDVALGDIIGEKQLSYLFQNQDKIIQIHPIIALLPLPVVFIKLGLLGK